MWLQKLTFLIVRSHNVACKVWIIRVSVGDSLPKSQTPELCPTLVSQLSSWIFCSFLDVAVCCQGRIQLLQCLPFRYSCQNLLNLQGSAATSDADVNLLLPFWASTKCFNGGACNWQISSTGSLQTFSGVWSLPVSCRLVCCAVESKFLYLQNF